MSQDLKQLMRRVIDQIVDLQNELDQLKGWQIERSLGPPASDRQLATIRELAGFELPRDYRLFMEMHNGWRGFSGEHDILSSEQMSGAPMAQSIAETKALQHETADPAATGFVIYASVSGSDLAFIDPTVRRPDGMANVVRWDPRMREYKRYPSFVEFLEGKAELLRERIVRERERHR